jgi:hypothetical protein
VFTFSQNDRDKLLLVLKAIRATLQSPLFLAGRDRGRDHFTNGNQMQARYSVSWRQQHHVLGI